MSSGPGCLRNAALNSRREQIVNRFYIIGRLSNRQGYGGVYRRKRKKIRGGGGGGGGGGTDTKLTSRDE